MTRRPDGRAGFVDVFRGLLIAHMALDHASLMFNRGRGGEELYRAQPNFPSDSLHAFARRLPSGVLLAAALAVLSLHPLIDVSGLPTPLRAVLYEPVREGRFRSLYPVVPWIGLVLLGFLVGRDAATRPHRERFWLALSALCLVFFFGIRTWGGYGNAYPTALVDRTS